MIETNELSIPLILPRAGSKTLLGIDETIITKEDLTSYIAWYRLIKYHDLNLKASDFKDPNLYIKYFLLSSGLLEYPVVLIHGLRGGGKSLFASWLTYMKVIHFGKRPVMEKPPPNPDLFGDKIHYLHDQDFVDKIIVDLARLDEIERITGKKPSQKDLENCIIYNAEFYNDESHMWADCNSRTNLTKLMYRIIMIARHLHLGMSLIFVDMNRIDKMLREQVTHIVSCQEEYSYVKNKTVCGYEIRDIRPGGTGAIKRMQLDPSDWLEIWDSHNIPTVVHDVQIYLGGNKKPKRSNYNFDLQAAAENIKTKE